MALPKPKPLNIVCTECGLPWEKHTQGRKTPPTLAVCIRLLKAELASRPRFSANQARWSSGSHYTLSGLQ